MPDIKGRLFLPNKRENQKDYGDNWRAMERWSAPVWRKLVLSTSWVDGSATFTVYGHPQYTINGFGMVSLAGLVRNPTAGSAIPALISTLPPGYRPPARRMFRPGGSQGGGDQTIRVDVLPDGTIVLVFIPAVGTIIDYIDLTSIHFYVQPQALS